MDDRIEEVRVIPTGDTEYINYLSKHDRTPAQKAQDNILDQAEDAASLALAKAEEAIEWLGVVTPVTARVAPVFLRQLIAEIVETRRLRQ